MYLNISFFFFYKYVKWTVIVECFAIFCSQSDVIKLKIIYLAKYNF